MESNVNEEVKEALKESVKEEEVKKIKFFTLGSTIYALLFTFFLYKNPSGITYPFYIAATLLFYCFYLKKLKITASKSRIIYMVLMLLLGISTMLTNSEIMLFWNKVFIFVLFFGMVVEQINPKAGNFGLSKYFNKVVNFSLGSIQYLFQPFTDRKYSREYCEKKTDEADIKKTRKKSNFKYVLYGLLIGLPLTAVIMALLISADRMFSDSWKKLFDFLGISHIEINFMNIFVILVMLLFSFFACYAVLTKMRKEKEEEPKDLRTREPIIAITFTSIISVIYISFCLVQALCLFGGFILPENYSYAEYARKGFFQLLAVCFINLILVAVCREYFRKSIVLQILLTIISGSTFVIIFSSAFRMMMYVKVYELTHLRVFVFWSLLVIGILMVYLIIHIYRDSFPFIKAAILTTAALYLLLSLAHPDYIIAKYNISNNQMEDSYYLENLSADALPAMNADYVTTKISIINKTFKYAPEGEQLQEKAKEASTGKHFNVSRYLAYYSLKNGY